VRCKGDGSTSPQLASAPVNVNYDILAPTAVGAICFDFTEFLLSAAKFSAVLLIHWIVQTI